MGQTTGGAGIGADTAAGGGLAANAIAGTGSTGSLFGMPFNDPEQLAIAAQNMQGMQHYAEFLGDTPDERTQNARAFAGMVDQLGKLGKTVSESTILQRMMKHRIRPIAQLSTGQQSGGIGAIPEYGGSGTQPIVNQMGFGGR